MATAAPPPLISSVEKTNGAKLSRLLIDGGTTVLRNLFDGFHPPANLAADLNTCYSTLNNLLRRKILNHHQWDQLFPPGGAAPDSNTFDITLLFLLLTNICGLSPPPSGWHNKPPPGDTSYEANLARIKFFRNVFYGHVSTTGVDTPTFIALWQEISAPLVALGLDQAEVHRLEAERGGEEDYLDALLEWADYEEDIKSQLKNIDHIQAKIVQTVEEVRRNQTKAQDTVEGIREIQMEDHEVLEDSNSKLEEVRQTQTKTQQTVEEVHQTQTKTQQIIEEVRQNQMKDRGTLQDSNSKLEEVRQRQTTTQQTVDVVHQVQMKDRETLQNSTSELKEVRHTLTKTQKTVEEVRQTLKEDHETLESNTSKLNEVHQSQTKTQHTVKEFAACLQEIKEDTSILKDGREMDKPDEVLSYLSKSEFKGDIEYHLQRFQADTREWVFTRVQNWLDDRNSQNRVMVISGNAGMGKSVIAAVICQRMQEAGKLSGSHFCQHNNAHYRNPQLMLQSLACHLSHTLSEYKQALVEKLSRNLGGDLNNMGVEELFALLFKEPLSTVGDPGRNMLTVIDGVDESEYQGRSELLDVMANQFCKLPTWIRFLVTTRPATNITKKLKDLKPFELESDDEKNVEDIRAVIQKELQHVIKQENEADVVEKLVLKSEGLMLFAYYLVLYLKQNPSVLDKAELDDSLPLRMTSVYESYFKRLEDELIKEVGIKEENFFDLLCAIIASSEPLPIDFVTKLLMPSRKSTVPIKRKVLKAISSVSSLLPIRDGCLHVIHKSVKDWLTDSSCYGEHDYIMEEKEGHRILADLCIDELDHVKWRGVRDAEFSATEKYALCHGAHHMFHSEEEKRPDRLEELTKTYVIDLELVCARLFVNNTRAAEDLLWLQRQDTFTGLSEDIQIIINTLLVLLRKHRDRFSSHPSVFFQTVLNEGGNELSREASSLLQDKYEDKTFVEYVYKEPWHGGVLARFHCSSSVACLDVSPKLDYMVCECMNGILQLWSLDTGRLLWKRPVKVSKSYVDGCGAFRKFSSTPVLSFYRSVVFYPCQDSDVLVLPGILSHTYSFVGDLKPLFSESKCRFSVCSISGDKTKILTDCPDDARCLVMWSLKNGSEVARVTREEDVLSFAWSRDGRLLAISHSSGLICLVDAMSTFTTLAQISTQQVCGVLKFSPDDQVLFCLHSLFPSIEPSLFCCVVRQYQHTFSFVAARDEVSYDPRKFKSFNDCGFLFGDPVSGPLATQTTFDFVLDKQILLRADPLRSHIKMLNADDADESTVAIEGRVLEIALSLDGQTMYAVSEAKRPEKPTVVVWDVSSGELVAQKYCETGFSICLVPVREGVLLTTTTDTSTLELWTSDLSDCIRSCRNVPRVAEMIPISDERIACIESRAKVNILDMGSFEIVSTIRVSDRRVLACNSKFHLITIDDLGSLCLSDGPALLWEKALGLKDSIGVCGVLSPAENVFVIWRSRDHGSDFSVHALDAVSGNTLHILMEDANFVVNDIKFISDEECVVFSSCGSKRFLHLYNVKSGNLLSVVDLRLPQGKGRLAACPGKLLVAIGFTHWRGSRFEVLRVWLRGDKDSRKNRKR